MNVVISESIRSQQLPGVVAVNYTREKMYVHITYVDIMYVHIT